MNQKLKVVFLSFLFFSGLTIHAQVATIKGKVLNAEGKPPIEAIVGLVNQSAPLSDVVKVNSDGSYEIKIKKQGPFTLEFDSPNHNPVWVPLYNNSDRSFTIDVNMAHYKYLDTFDEVKVMGIINGFVSMSDALPMQKQADGKYSITFKSKEKEILYQIVGVVESRSINGTEGTRFEPDYYGDYNSVLPVKDSIVTIVFDPAKVVKGGAEQKVVISGSSFDEKFYEMASAYNKAYNEVNIHMKKWRDDKKNPADFVFDSGNYIPDLDKYIESEKDPELQKIAKLNYLAFCHVKIPDYSMEKAAKWYESIPISDPIWETNMSAFMTYRNLFKKEKADEIENRFLAESKIENIKMTILVNRLSSASFKDDKEELTKLHELIKTKYPNNKTLQSYLQRFPIEGAVRLGNQIPDFEVTSLDNPAEKFSKKSMLGKIYMIDFWATWCSPCVGEMEGLHKAFAKFKDKGFEIVSLSVDQGVKEITKFRKEKFPMPWKNAYINDAEGRKVSEKFGVVGIPMPILVGPKGEVLAMNLELRSEKIEETLAKYLGGEK